MREAEPCNKGELRVFHIPGKSQWGQEESEEGNMEERAGPACSSGAHVEGTRTKDAREKRSGVDITTTKNLLMILFLVFLFLSLISVTEFLTFTTKH